ncbi:MAG: cyclic nucleotide-binding domain, partial [Trebouxia sp. A1-2]
MELADLVSLSAFAVNTRTRRNIAIGLGALVFLAGIEGYNSGISRLLRALRRAAATSIANWAEEQGGIPLFTIEGEEPDSPTASWNLPALSKHTSIANAATADSLSDDRARTISEGWKQPKDHANFFATTKFFSCLDLAESQELLEASQMVVVQPNETLFETGDDSSSGIFIVLEGAIGVYMHDGDKLMHTNTLRPGESVGDVDILDGGHRTCTCAALGQGAQLVQVSHQLFMSFVMARPRTLQIYLHKALARLWRVAHFVLSDFLNLSLQQSAETSSPLLGLNMAPAESLMVENPSHATARSGQRPAPTKSAGKSTHDKYEAANMASNDAQPPGK